jgi:hypothetical protein
MATLRLVLAEYNGGPVNALRLRNGMIVLLRETRDYVTKSWPFWTVSTGDATSPLAAVAVRARPHGCAGRGFFSMRAGSE